MTVILKRVRCKSGLLDLHKMYFETKRPQSFTDLHQEFMIHFQWRH